VSNIEYLAFIFDSKVDMKVLEHFFFLHFLNCAL